MKRMKKKALIFAVAIAAAATVAIGMQAMDEYLNRKAWEKTIVAVYPMANQNITWSGAGYNGIWERGRK